MNIGSLNVISKVNLKLSPARHKHTLPKACPEPCNFFNIYCIVALIFYTHNLYIQHIYKYDLIEERLRE